jgi:hypothetical protein
LKYLEAINCGQNIKFVNQVIGSTQNWKHLVRQLFSDPNDLKFEFVRSRTLKSYVPNCKSFELLKDCHTQCFHFKWFQWLGQKTWFPVHILRNIYSEFQAIKSRKFKWNHAISDSKISKPIIKILKFFLININY